MREGLAASNNSSLVQLKVGNRDSNAHGNDFPIDGVNKDQNEAEKKRKVA